MPKVLNVWFQKISIPTPLKVIRNSEGVGVGAGVTKAKSLKGNYGAKLQFLEGWGLGGLKPKTFYGGCMDIFSNNTL